MSNRDLSRYPYSQRLMPLSEAMGQLFREAFTASGAGSSIASTGVNLFETNDGYVVQLLLPGVDPAALSITARENVVTVQGTMQVAAPENARSLVVSIPAGEVSEHIQVPSDVDAETASADYRDGVLILTLPKAEHAKVRTIKVSERSGRQQAIEGETTKG